MFVGISKRAFSLDIPKMILPRLRNMIVFDFDAAQESEASMRRFIHGKFRLLQFNMLADGLSGLRDDLGAFSRAKEDDVLWENRKGKLLHEILQYNPDVITMQECDHYYDFFLPALTANGYDGIFAPKPASACLEVSDNSDGCAIFFKRNIFKILSTEVHYSTYDKELNIDHTISTSL